MSTLNTKAKQAETTNLAGGPAFDRTNIKQELISVVLNKLNNKDCYYMTDKEIDHKLQQLLAKNNNEFIAKLMVFTRNTIGLRLVPKSLADYLIKNAKGTDFLVPALSQSFVRPDDMTDLLALSSCKKSNAFKRAAKYCLENKWDAYQLKKYEQKKLKVKLKDIVKLVHPSLNNYNKKFDNNLDIFKLIIESKLPNIQTAQTMNSAKVEYNKEIIGKLGYLALVKNLVNIFKDNSNDLTDLVDYVCSRIQDKNAVQKSKILPFRFIDAFDKVSHDLELDEFLKQKIKKALVVALTYSKDTLNIKGKTAILLDESGSMNGRPFTYGKALSASLLSENSLLYTWANYAQLRNFSSAYDLVSGLDCGGGGTDINAPLESLIKTNTKVDNIIILTDMEMYNLGSSKQSFMQRIAEYKKINPDVKIVFWNLQPYGDAAPVKFGKNILEVSSCSDYIVSILGNILEDPNYLIKEIESVDLTHK